MPILGVIASSVNIGGGYWGTALNSNSNQTQFASIFIDDSSKACYQVYSYNFGNSPQPSIVKLNADGTFSYQRTYSASLPSGNALGGGGVDSSGNVYFAGVANQVNNNPTYLLKMTSSGTLSVQKVWNNTNEGSVLGRALCLNPGGAQLMLASTGQQSQIDPCLNLFDTSFNAGVSARWNGTGNQNQNGVLMPDQRRVSTWASAPQFMLNTDNSVRWAVTSGDYFNGSGCTNPNGDLFFIPPSGGNGLDVAKINTTTGALIWAKRLTENSNSKENVGIVANNSFVYTMFYGSNGTTGNITISKRNASDGSLVWQRRLSSSTSGKQDLRGYGAYYTNGQTIAVDSTDQNLYFSCYAYDETSSKVQYIWKVPADGSKTGTYSLNSASFTWGSSSLTDSSFTPSRTSTSAGSVSQSISQTNGGNSLSSSQYVSTSKVVIP